MSQLRIAIAALFRHAVDRGVAPTIWWRDDDAVAPSPALERLLAEARRLDLPLGLAIIPQQAQPSLWRLVADGPILPMVHGLRHANHALPEEKKSEFPGTRAARDVAADLATALAHHRTATTRPAWFVPPWNRIAPLHADALESAGFMGLSLFADRRFPSALPRLDTHVDPIDWRGTRRACGDEVIVAQTEAALGRRLSGGAFSSPIGLLTHHLAHDETIWSKSRDWLEGALHGGAKPFDVLSFSARPH